MRGLYLQLSCLFPLVGSLPAQLPPRPAPSPPSSPGHGGREALGLSACCAEVAEVLHASWDRVESVNKSRKEGGPGGSPGGPVVKIHTPKAGGLGSISSQGTKIPRAARCGPQNCFLIKKKKWLCAVPHFEL